MKTLLIVIVVLVVLIPGGLAVANLALENTDVKTHAVAGSVREIVVKSDSGDVDLVAAGSRVEVRETQHYVFKKPQLDQNLAGGVLTLDAHCNGLAFNCSTDLRVTVPAGVKVSVEANSGDVEGQRLALSDVHVETDSGDVSLQFTGKQALVWAHTDSGDVAIDSADVRAVDAQADSGDVRVEAGGAPRRVAANADSGDVDVTVPGGVYAVRVDTDSGDVDLDQAISRNDRAPQSIDARADSGDVTVRAS